MKIHVVKRGDSLWGISRQYGISTTQIVRVNSLENPETLVIGQALVIPEPYLRYTVQLGDTLANIAAHYGTTVQEIMQTNNMTNPSSLYPGQTIFIPVIYHTVRAGDTFYKIAASYGTTPEAIVQANQLTTSSRLYIGQTLKIPTVPKPIIDVNAFLYTFGQTGAQQVREVAYDLTYVSPFGYRMKEDGSLEGIDDIPTIQAAQSTGVVPMMAITNFSSTEAGTDLAHTILSNPDLVEKLLTNIDKSDER